MAVVTATEAAASGVGYGTPLSHQCSLLHERALIVDVQIQRGGAIAVVDEDVVGALPVGGVAPTHPLAVADHRDAAAPCRQYEPILQVEVPGI